MGFGAILGGIGSNLFGIGMNLGNAWLSSAMQTHFQKELQESQQNWLQQMSNTAHQREIADLHKAGLNPLISLGGSGASTPSAGMGNIGMQDSPLLTASTASQLKNDKANRGLTTAQTNLTNQQTETEKSRQALNWSEKALKDSQRILNDKEAGVFDKKFAEVMKNLAMDTQLKFATANANQMNAISERMNAQTNQMVGSANKLKIEAEEKYVKGKTALLGKEKKFGRGTSNETKLWGMGGGSSQNMYYEYYD